MTARSIVLFSEENASNGQYSNVFAVLMGASSDPAHAGNGTSYMSCKRGERCSRYCTWRQMIAKRRLNGDVGLALVTKAEEEDILSM